MEIKLSDYQIKEAERITAAGGLYFVAKDMQSFIDWWQKQFTKNKVISENNKCLQK